MNAFHESKSDLWDGSVGSFPLDVLCIYERDNNRNEKKSLQQNEQV